MKTARAVTGARVCRPTSAGALAVSTRLRSSPEKFANALANATTPWNSEFFNSTSIYPNRFTRGTKRKLHCHEILTEAK
ncbi:unnamed protein product, partial [Iphiclides podalirius]